MVDDRDKPTESQVNLLKKLLNERNMTIDEFEDINGIKMDTITKYELGSLLENMINRPNSKSISQSLNQQQAVTQSLNQPQTTTQTPNKQSQQQSHQIIQRINNDVDTDEPYGLFDALDNDQIVKYMETAMEQSYFYVIPMDNREIYGISYAGTIAVAKALSAKRKINGEGGIEILPDVIVTETSDTIRAIVRAKDKSIDLIVIGTSEQPKMKKICERRENGKCVQYRLEVDPFAYTIAVSKASRNALRQLIPEDAILQLYADWKNKKK